MSKLAGYREFTSKKSGKLCRMIAVMSPYSDREKENGAIGNRVEEIFLPENSLPNITETDIGKEVVIDYDIVGGRAFVNGVVLKK